MFRRSTCSAPRPAAKLDPTLTWILPFSFSTHLSEREAWKKRLQLGARVAERLSREVDLFIMGEADLDLTFRILQQGRRLFERDRSNVRAREAFLVSLYYDYQPFLERYLKRTAEHYG